MSGKRPNVWGDLGNLLSEDTNWANYDKQVKNRSRKKTNTKTNKIKASAGKSHDKEAIDQEPIKKNKIPKCAKCANCGKEFKRKVKSYRYCSVECDIAVLNARRERSREANRKHYYIKRYGKAGVPPPRDVVCVVCAKTFSVTSGGGRQKIKTCSPECFRERKSDLERKYQRIRREKARKGGMYLGREMPCKVCGAAFTTDGRRKTCSDGCQAKNIHASKVASRKRARPNYKAVYRKKCQICEKEFSFSGLCAHRILNCSHECAAEATRRRNHRNLEARRLKRIGKCPICSASFTRYIKGSKFCSSECADIKRQQQIEKNRASKNRYNKKVRVRDGKPTAREKLVCITCGKSFTYCGAGIRAVRNCSPKCSYEHRMKRDAAYKAEKKAKKKA